MDQREFARKIFSRVKREIPPVTKGTCMMVHWNLLLGGIARILVLFLGKDSFLFRGGDAYG